jgi:hypothetical protein
MNNREMALGRLVMLRKELYQIGTRAMTFVKEIQDEVNAFAFTEDDFTTIDFKKVKTLSEEIMKLQKEYQIRIKEADSIKTTYNFEEE